ncbi:MAG: formimidoylglutamate deiminase [Alphaproteobacteria bacterium]
MQVLFCEWALLPEGWTRDVRLDIADDGNIAAIHSGSAAGSLPRAAGPVIPGMPNLHSHAFQRAMAGAAERGGPAGDSFWTWRELMYGLVARLSPDQVGAIAAQLYLELLKNGYTAVAEFHYLHHRPDGGRYDAPAELSHRVVEAAREVGIAITHLPVLYTQGGFGGAPAEPAQRRFVCDLETFVRILDELMARYRGDPQVRLGIAPHSLRAVDEEALAAALAALDERDGEAPVHIHVAEQEREVEECRAWCGARPVARLLDTAEVSARWCLVHATHMDDGETRRLAASGAVAGLCPTTEANLGDGIFPASAFLAAGGVFGVGSDSQISVSPVEELRWLEYVQRLTQRRRVVLAATEGGSVGAALYRAALEGGARACGRPIGALEPARRADLVVLDGAHPALVGRHGDALLDAYVFAGNESPVSDVMVGGRWLITRRHHDKEEEILARFRAAIDALAA